MIDISKIKVEFGGDNPPKDQRFIDLFEDAIVGKLLVRLVLVKIEGIRPFSDFRPEISDGYRKYFEELEGKGTPPPLYVYPDKDHFIMSDDYNAYFLYKEKKYTEIMCILLGDSDSEYIIEKSEPFPLPPPQIAITEK